MSFLDGARAERLVAKRYEERGYTVIIEPPPAAIPFPLEGYKPDLLATKDSENLLIEVKRRGARVDSKLFFRVDEEVQRHPGWQFLLVTVADEELHELSTSTTAKLNEGVVQERLQQLDLLLNSDMPVGFLLPTLWVAYVSVLRLLVAHEGNIEGASLDNLTDFSFINKAYSEGVTSIDEYQSARRFLNLRNNAVHSLDTVATTQECQELRGMIDEVICRLSLKES
ncbi:hypothetical protein PSH85_00860 [Pseudomonas simiae]|uniref:hypothetical protein n=1 Tax=Pseudomonas simiae TaxID=321846 RepID=UPI002734904D|nr:hypothetical protein [Pseudomonas simiae]WLG34342.1 hypothetical protein PSH82_00860 [Pseudomonas simiae]WLI24302.1 hypothetical protein PSH85_00860 [Pseudomonas simiae]